MLSFLSVPLSRISTSTLSCACTWKVKSDRQNRNGVAISFFIFTDLFFMCDYSLVWLYSHLKTETALQSDGFIGGTAAIWVVDNSRFYSHTKVGRYIEIR